MKIEDRPPVLKPTVELRWFFSEPVRFDEYLVSFNPTILVEVENQPTRHDFYLLDSGERIGIKWREGNIEIKQQQSEAETYENNNVVGYLEHWEKWSFPLAGPGDFRPTNRWLKISKRRRLLTLAYDATTRGVSPVADDQAVVNRCELEYTQLRVADRDYYTLGAEASGESAHLQETLLRTMDYLAENSNLNCLNLTRARSSNYARWIRQYFA